MENKSKSDATGCVIFAGGLFALAVISTIFGFIFKGESFLSDFLDSDSEGTNIGYLRFTFGLLIVAGIFFYYNNYIKEKK
jgi:hypothetical protein